jgi:hypothetical protein
MREKGRSRSLQFGLTGGIQSIAGSVSCGTMVRGTSGVVAAKFIVARGTTGRAAS